MLTLNDGRTEIWQWDTGRALSVDAECSQVHFSNKVFGRSIDVDVADGVAIIPDVLLQTDKDLNVWAFVGTAENGYTKISKTFKVNRRNKPADYVFTPTDQTSLEEIKEKIDYLESIQDPDAIKNAVEDYLAQNPVESPVQSVNGQTGAVELNAEDVGAISVETDPTVPGWAKKPEKPTYTAAEVGALPDTYKPPVDTTMTKPGQAADAAEVGNRLSALSEEMLTEESDPTVPSWAKASQKPSYTASEVGADPSGTAASKVSAHNIGTDTHSDIRLLIQGLTDRLNALADSDDTTLDQLSEVVSYIKSNRSLIEAITTSKVGVADIVDNLTTNVANKPLSAAQGVALKALIDAITIPEALPNPNALTFTGAVTGSYDGSAPLTVEIPSGGGGSDWELIAEITSDGAGTNSGLFAPISFNSYKELHLEATSIADSSITFRLMLSKTTNWYDGQVILSGATTNAVAYMAHFWIIDGYIKVISGRNSGYVDAQNDGTCKFVNSPRYAFATSDYAYIRFDANNSAVPEGATLKIWGVK